MRKVSIFLSIMGILAAVALAGCGGGGGSSSNASNNGSNNLSGTVLTGTIYRTVGSTTTNVPVPGVIVSIGNPVATGVSGSDGKFRITLTGRSGSHLLQEISPLIFSVDVQNAGSDYPMYLKVRYADYDTDPNTLLWTAKNALPIPTSIINGGTDLGAIYVDYYDSNSSGDTPPRPLDPDEYEDSSSNTGGSDTGGSDTGGGDTPPSPPAG